MSFAYAVMSRRVFDVWNFLQPSTPTADIDSESSNHIKPVLCLNADLTNMTELAISLLNENEPTVIYIVDPYLQILDRGITGTILRPTLQSSRELVENFMNILQGGIDDFDTRMFGENFLSRLVYCPILPINILKFNQRAVYNKEDEAEHMIVNDAVSEINNSVLMYYSQQKLETPDYDLRLVCLVDDEEEAGGNGLTISRMAAKVVQECIETHFQQIYQVPF